VLVGYPAAVDQTSRAELRALLEEATADCHGEDEQIMGLTAGIPTQT
jgi:hypothetical protein